MGLSLVYLTVSRLFAWLRLSRRCESWKSAEILLLRHQLAVLQRQVGPRPKLSWADRAFIALLLDATPKRRRARLASDGYTADRLALASRHCPSPLGPRGWVSGSRGRWTWLYPVVFIDAIHVKIRDGNVANRPIYVALAVTVEGTRDILGLWAGEHGDGEGAKYWLRVLAEIKNRGTQDVCLVVCDGLKGVPEAIAAVWPQAITQRGRKHAATGGDTSSPATAESTMQAVVQDTFGSADVQAAMGGTR